jgi:two-component system sensor histidine kinase EvgS
MVAKTSIVYFLAWLLWHWCQGFTTFAYAVDGDRLVFGGNNDFSPYEFTNERNEPDGYNIDLIKAVARQIGAKVQVELGPFAAVRRDLESGRVNGLTGVLYSAERDKVFDFSIPHVVISYAVFVRKDSGIKTPMDLEGKEVAVVKGVYAHEWLIRNDFTPHVVAVDRPEEALTSLSRGHYDCAVLIRLNGLDLMRTLKIDNIKTIGPPVLTQKMGFAVKAGDADLLARLNEGLYLVQNSGEYDRIFLKWFSVYEQNKTRKRLLALGVWIGVPLVALLLLAGGWIWSLNRLVTHRTKKLNENQVLLNRIVQGTPLPTLVADRNGKIIFWNRACEELTGILSIDAVGRQFGKVAAEKEDETYLLKMIAGSVGEKAAGKQVTHRSTSREHAAGASEVDAFVPELGDQGAWLSAVIVQFKSEEGRSLGTIETWQDLTERKVLEKKLVQSQRLEAMGRLAGAIAHDFTNYLQAVMVYSETALAEISHDSPVRPHLEGIRETVDRAKGLVLQIKVFSRQRWLKPKAIPLKNVVAKAVEAIRATAPEDIRIRLAADSDARIMGDEIPISQVVTNLCMNALSAMCSGGGTLTVQLADTPNTSRTNLEDKGIYPVGYVKLTVSDTGHGIPAEHLERIFEPFFTTRKHDGGTGMGLAIIHGIVKGYGGEITVTSRVGKGSVFSVFWPVAGSEIESSGNQPDSLDTTPGNKG